MIPASGDAQSPQLRPELCRLPILIGVTGHRDISEWGREKVLVAVRSVLQAIKDDYGDGAPIAVISSLAKGADQLVAEAALDIGLGVRAILPLPPERIESADPAAQASARRILAHSKTEATDLSSFLELEGPLTEARGNNPIQQDQLRYEQAGLVVARHSHILLALVHPDDVAALSPQRDFRTDDQAPFGGSRRIVEFWITGRLDGGIVGRSALAPQGSLLRPVLTGPLLHIATPRDSKDDRPELPTFAAGALTAILPAEAEVGTVAVDDRSHRRYLTGYFGEGTCTLQLLLSEENTSKRGWLQRCTQRALRGVRHLAMPRPNFWDPPQLGVLPRIVQFNATVCEMANRRVLVNPIQRSLDDIVDEDRLKQLTLGDPLKESRGQVFLLKRQRHLFAGADGLANVEQASLKRRDRCILGAIPVSIFLFELFEEFFPNVWMLLLYVFVFLIALLTYLSVRRKDLQDRYQDCRLLGEAARVQFFWSLAGLPYSVADEYQANELGEGSWLYPAIKAVALQGLMLAEHSRARDFVLTNWLGAPLSVREEDVPNFSYRKWYRKSAALYRSGHQWAGRWRLFFFCCGYVIALGTIVLLAGKETGWFGHGPLIELVQKTLIVLIPTIPALGAVLVLWRERRAYEVHAHEYHRMDLLVQEGLALLSRHAGERNWEAQILRSIGREALHEVTRWLLAHRSQPVHPVPA